MEQENCLDRKSAFVIRLDSRGVFLYINKQRKESLTMSGIMMMIIAIVVLGGAYLLYGRYLPEQMGHRSKSQNSGI